MLYYLVVLTLTCPILSAAARYYVILRLPPNTTLHETSAQFKLFQPNNGTRAWDCRSGPNPIVYPSGLNHVISAKSIDLQLGLEVECLGLSIRVVVGETVLVWQGQESECPGFLTSTTELERSDSETTQYFQLTPTVVFQVYSTRPSGKCARRQLQYVTHPRVAFSYNNNNTLTTCHVLSRQLHVLSCNMTITTGPHDVIATATVATEIQIPRFIWQLGIKTIKCSCVCRIQQSESESESLGTIQDIRTYTILHNTPTTTPEPYRSPEPDNTYLVVVCIVTVLLFLSTITAIFFMNLSRQLNKRLGRLGVPDRARSSTLGHARAPPSFHPGMGPGLHSIRNECHHYNTVSLRLSDCVELGRQTYERPSPIYQKLSHSEEK